MVFIGAAHPPVARFMLLNLHVDNLCLCVSESDPLDSWDVEEEAATSPEDEVILVC